MHCPLLGVRPDAGPDRYSATDVLVQVRLGPAPIGLEEAVSAVPRNEHRLQAEPDRAGLLGQRRLADCAVSDLGQVVANQPEPDWANWRPLFLDYLYLSFTNATAFSPTDAMPYSRWAKMLMLVESAASLLLAIMVVARAVNILR